MGKFYAVKVGKTPGIYESWDACSAMVHGYPGAVFKSFPTREEAERFLGEAAPGMRQAEGGLQAGEEPLAHVLRTDEEPVAGREKATQPDRCGNLARVAGSRKPVQSEGAKKADGPGLPDVYAFVDGSYNAATKVYGYGGFLIHHGKKEILQGSGCEDDMAPMRNVAGEIEGSMAAVRRALELKLPEITIYYDYMGIEMWATGAWKRNKEGTAAYHDYIASVKDQIEITFVKVKGHSGVEGNEEADTLAKEAVGNVTD